MSTIPSPIDSVNALLGLRYVRVGVHGHVGCFALSEPLRLKRGDRLVCRTNRGIEMGILLGSASEKHWGLGELDHAAITDGSILRRTTPEDELLWAQLRQLGEEAYENCTRWIADQGSSAILLEVEPLLDGRTLYFHFLTFVEAHIQDKLDQLAKIYEREVRQSKFARLLEHGCGPGCGTAEAKNGCGTSGGCAVCSIASACKN